MFAQRLALGGLAVFAVVGLGATLAPWIQDLLAQDCTAEFYAQYFPELWRKVALAAIGLVCVVSALAAVWGAWKVASGPATRASAAAILTAVACFAVIYSAAPLNAVSVDGADSYSCYIDSDG